MKHIIGLATTIALSLGASTLAANYSGSGREIASAPEHQQALRPVTSFKGYADQSALSLAYFEEAGRVITSPRCMNCHPATRSPTQGDDRHAHIPHVSGGADDKGAGLRCDACHHAGNTPVWGDNIQSVPGHTPWALAPAGMAWQDKSLGQICMLLKDPIRNGGRSLAQIHIHMADDGLVGWAWRPGAGRLPAPGTQKSFGTLIEAWIKTGAICPPA